MIKFRQLLSRLTGWRYHYRVSLTYKNAQGRRVQKITMGVILTHPSFITEHRKAKQVLAPELIKAIPKRCLCNGVIQLEPVAYLDWFRPRRKN